MLATTAGTRLLCGRIKMNTIAQLGRVAARQMMKHAADLSRRGGTAPSNAAMNSPMNRSLNQQQRGLSSMETEPAYGSAAGHRLMAGSARMAPMETEPAYGSAAGHRLMGGRATGPKISRPAPSLINRPTPTPAPAPTPSTPTAGRATGPLIPRPVPNLIGRNP